MTFKLWLHGLTAAAIGAFSSSITLLIVDPAKFNFSAEGFLSLAKVSLVAAIVAVAGYLAKSPLPESSSDSSTTRKLGVWMLCAFLLLGTTTGCTSTQVANVVKNIAVYAQEAQPLITEAIALVTAFSAEPGGVGGNSAELQLAGVKIQKDLADLVSLCNSYTSNPSSSTWNQIIALVDELVTTSDSSLTDLAGIKSANSQRTALTVLASLDALLHTIDGFVQSAESSTQVKAMAAKRAIKLQQVSQYWSTEDKNRLAQSFGRSYERLYSQEMAMGF